MRAGGRDEPAGARSKPAPATRPPTGAPASASAPPNILLTTPESLAVLLSLPDAPRAFGGLRAVMMDEVHALAGTKRGDQLALGVERLVSLAPAVRRVGLSATVAHPDAIQAYAGRVTA